MAKDIFENAGKLLNRVLQQDETTLDAIGELADKVIAIEVIGFDLVVYLQFDAAGITLKQEYAGKVDVTIKARPVTLLVMLSVREENVAPRDIEIIGDVQLAQCFQTIMQNLEIDWEECMSHWLGDTLAHKLGNLLRDTRRYAKETRSTIGMDISEYLRYEKEMLADQSEVDQFVAAVDVIRNNAERLKQRIKNLERKII